MEEKISINSKDNFFWYFLIGAQFETLMGLRQSEEG